MIKVISIIERINEIVGKVCSYSILIVMCLVVYEVLTRRLLNKPTVWTFETITIFYGFHFMMSFAFTLMNKAMVNVDLLYNKLSERKRAIVDIITYLTFFFPFVVGVLYFAIPWTIASWQQLERSWSVFAPPIYPFKTVVPVAFSLLVLQGIAEILKRVATLKKKEEN